MLDTYTRKHEIGNVDVLCVGTAAYDLVFEVARHPDHDEKAVATALHRGGGGPAANAAVAVTRLGLSAAFCGYLGNDPFGDLHLNELGQEGVDTRWVHRGDTATPLSSVLVKPGGARALVNYNEHPGLANLPSDILQISQPDVILFDGWEPDISVSVLEQARRLNIKTVLDAGSVHRGTSALAQDVDYLVASEKFALDYTRTDSAAAALQVMNSLNNTIVITCGENGLLWFNDGQSGRRAAFDVDAIDTTGAGDAFHGAFAAGLCLRLQWPDLLNYASAAAALNCTKIGARAALPYRHDLEAFLRQNSQ